MSSPQEMWEALPPVTRAWLGVSVLTTALVSFGTIEWPKLALSMPLVYEKFELWRLMTCFVFFGKFSFSFLIQMFILSRYSASMEMDPYRTSHAGGTPDYLFALIIMAVMFLAIGWGLQYLFMGQSLVFAVLYLWSKRNPEAPTSIWGFRFKGAQLPWALIAFNVLIGQSPVGDLLGVFVGHVYYFLAEVLPLSNGRQILHTPEWLIRMVENLTGQGFGAAPAPGARAPGAPANPARHNWGVGGRPLGAG